MPLTDRSIKNLKLTDKEYFVADRDGLYLRMRPTGTKTFIYRTQIGGKSKKETIGNYPAMGLAAARERCVELIAKKHHPLKTLQEAYDEWDRRVLTTKKSPDQVRYRMKLHILSHLSEERLTDITRAQLSERLTAVAETAPVQGNRVLGDIKLLLNYAVDRGWLENSPAERITTKSVGGTEPARTRVLAEEDLLHLFAALRSDRFGPKIRYALILLLLTGQRSGEVRGLTSAEVVGRTWTIPAERTKNSRVKNAKDHVVALPYATSLLAASTFKELGSFPFEGVERQELARAMTRMRFTTRTTPHDLRRTMATHMADLGVAPHVIEKCLNHALGGVMAIYNRAEYLPERRAAWRLWALYLMGLAKKKPPSEGG